MEYVYAALMLHKLKKDITEENVTSIVKASGAEVNEAKVKSLVASLADVNIEDAIKAAPVAAAAPAAAPAAPAAPAASPFAVDPSATGSRTLPVSVSQADCWRITCQPHDWSAHAATGQQKT